MILICVQLSEGGFQIGLVSSLDPMLVVPLIRSCQSPIRRLLVELHLHLR